MKANRPPVTLVWRRRVILESCRFVAKYFRDSGAVIE
jgi:hypothetical protein